MMKEPLSFLKDPMMGSMTQEYPEESYMEEKDPVSPLIKHVMDMLPMLESAGPEEKLEAIKILLS